MAVPIPGVSWQDFLLPLRSGAGVRYIIFELDWIIFCSSLVFVLHPFARMPLLNTPLCQNIDVRYIPKRVPIELKNDLPNAGILRPDFEGVKKNLVRFYTQDQPEFSSQSSISARADFCGSVRKIGPMYLYSFVFI